MWAQVQGDWQQGGGPVLKALTDSTQASGLKSSQNRQQVQVRGRQSDSRVVFAITESEVSTPKPCLLLQEAPVLLPAGLCCDLVLGGPHAKELCCEAEFSKL